MADFLVFVTVQPSAKLQQMMHRNGKKRRKNSENTPRNTFRLNGYEYTVSEPEKGIYKRYIGGNSR